MIDSNTLVSIGDSLTEYFDWQGRFPAKEFKAEYLDVFSLFVDSNRKPRDEYLLDDGVHLSDDGYDLWAKVVEGFLRVKFDPRRQLKS